MVDVGLSHLRKTQPINVGSTVRAIEQMKDHMLYLESAAVAAQFTVYVCLHREREAIGSLLADILRNPR
jgi:hypothetical protein